MTKHYSESIIDVSPWPTGLGFTDANLWWEYVWSRDEPERLNLLLLTALLNDEIAQLLLARNTALMQRFHLSESTVRWLNEIQATSLYSLSVQLLTKLSEGGIQ